MPSLVHEPLPDRTGATAAYSVWDETIREFIGSGWESARIDGIDGQSGKQQQIRNAINAHYRGKVRLAVRKGVAYLVREDA